MLAIVALLVAACGGGGDDADTPDAGLPGGDAAVGDGGLPPGCDVAEADDVGNATTAEATGLSLGATAITICGKVNAREPDGDGVVDVDRYAFTVASAGGFVVRLASAGGGNLAELSSEVFDGAGRFGHGLYVGNHLVYVTRLDAGDFTVDVVARHGARPAADVGYRLSVTPADLDQRCTQVTTGPVYTEAYDGVASTGNDVIEVRWSSMPARALTADTDDAPEPTNIVVSAAMTYRLIGVIGADTDPDDEYLDRDTYQLLTGGQANELDVRLTWPVGGADLDVLLFPAAGDGAPIEIADAALISTTGPELLTTAVLPSTPYWLWIGAYDASTGLPVAYEATVCGSAVTP
ncbi:MAG: hypothetical protein KC464_25155 [Myxococcales bacterium]|nr:hypothetical protein [Myxococcales bacterium]